MDLGAYDFQLANRFYSSFNAVAGSMRMARVAGNHMPRIIIREMVAKTIAANRRNRSGDTGVPYQSIGVFNSKWHRSQSPAIAKGVTITNSRRPSPISLRIIMADEAPLTLRMAISPTRC